MLEKQLYSTMEAGVDEAGRGCLAGPVYAAAVILPEDFEHPLLNDSKKMTERHRYQLREIIEQQAVAWCVAEVSPQQIDSVNILNATFIAMNKAIDGLITTPTRVLIDGNRFRTENTSMEYHCIIGGDAKYLSIAAASVLAKTYRDDRMLALAEEFPQYGWKKNKGYPTEEHRRAIALYGTTSHHRMSFGCCQPTLF